jgi:hypothetical protein
MKTCSDCGQEKELTEFGKQAKNADGLNAKCKPCKRDYDNAYYRDKPGRAQQVKDGRIRAEMNNKVFIWKYLFVHPCVDCGERDPAVLEFDHLGDKKYNVSEMYKYSREMLEAEIAKCEVRCANCHKRMTDKRGSHWRHIAGMMGLEHYEYMPG